MAIALIALQHFYFRTATDYYSAGDFRGGTNYWELANQISLYGGLGIWGVASLTQLFALIDVAIEFNVFIWVYGVRYLAPLLGATVFGLLFATYDLAYQDLKHSDTGRAAKAALVKTAVYDDM